MQGASKLQQPLPPQQVHEGVERKVVYLPTCVTRMMGPSLNDPERASTHEKLLSLFNKADYEVVYPEVSRITAAGSWRAVTEQHLALLRHSCKNIRGAGLLCYGLHTDLHSGRPGKQLLAQQAWA